MPIPCLGDRLLAHSRDRSDYLIFAGFPADQPTELLRVIRIDDTLFTLSNLQVLKSTDISAYLVAYPNGGILEQQHPRDISMPDGIQFSERSETHDHDTLTAADLAAGRDWVKVSYGKRPRTSTLNHYSTTLTNLSDKRIRVRQFGGYLKDGAAFVLRTTTNRFFSHEDFIAWYGQRGDWIYPGQSVTDHNNYGDPPVLWAYYCEADDGTKFLAGDILSKFP